jgi:hypothetical protein
LFESFEKKMANAMSLNVGNPLHRIDSSSRQSLANDHLPSTTISQIDDNDETSYSVSLGNSTLSESNFITAPSGSASSNNDPLLATTAYLNPTAIHVLLIESFVLKLGIGRNCQKKI